METVNNPIMPKKLPHHGRNIKKFRGLREMKQATLAELLGKSVNWLYEIEKKEIISDEILQQVADALQVHIDILKNLTDESEIQINFNDNQITASNVGHNEINNDVKEFTNIIDNLYNRITEKEIRIHDLEKELEQYKKK